MLMSALKISILFPASFIIVFGPMLWVSASAPSSNLVNAGIEVWGDCVLRNYGYDDKTGGRVPQYFKEEST